MTFSPEPVIQSLNDSGVIKKLDLENLKKIAQDILDPENSLTE